MFIIILIVVFDYIIVSTLREFIRSFHCYTTIGNSFKHTGYVVITTHFKYFYTPTVVDTYHIVWIVFYTTNMEVIIFTIAIY